MNIFFSSLVDKCDISHQSLFCSVKVLIVLPSDSSERKEWCFSRYEKKGFDHVVYLGNFEQRIADAKSKSDNTSLILTTKSGSKLTDLLNAFVNKYCVNKWLMVVEYGQEFIWPRLESRSLGELVSHLEDNAITTMQVLHLDLECLDWSRSEASSLMLANDYSRYDAYVDLSGHFRSEWGEVYREASSEEIGNPKKRKNYWENKTSRTGLIFWEKNYIFAGSYYVLEPERLNYSYSHNKVSGVIITPKNKSMNINGLCKVKFEGDKQLITNGLMSLGEWY